MRTLEAEYRQIYRFNHGGRMRTLGFLKEEYRQVLKEEPLSCQIWSPLSTLIENYVYDEGYGWRKFGELEYFPRLQELVDYQAVEGVIER